MTLDPTLVSYLYSFTSNNFRLSCSGAGHSPGVQGWAHVYRVLAAVLPFPAFTEFPAREEALGTEGGIVQDSIDKMRNRAMHHFFRLA